MRFQGLKPFVPPKARILILGTFPGACSLRCQQYYADSSNEFWKILCRISKVDYDSIYSYRKRLALLRSMGIALWDVIKSCERMGSADSNIIKPKFNDLNLINGRSISEFSIFFNGRKAETLYVQGGTGLPRGEYLLSSSGACRRSLADKTRAWRKILKI
ncbi:MAG: DNA-deoxyinosine glycosylase [Candidatus Zixiibacteriota bacterium]